MSNIITYKPGQIATQSGIYRVLHDFCHSKYHEVTVVAGDRFPPCHGCSTNLRFALVRAAIHINYLNHR